VINIQTNRQTNGPKCNAIASGEGKNKKAIRESLAASAAPSTKVVTQSRHIHVEVIEKALNVWLEDPKQYAFKWTSDSRKAQSKTWLEIICQLQQTIEN